jgi:tetratricopeptide (TPR) repeat protein
LSFWRLFVLPPALAGFFVSAMLSGCAPLPLNPLQNDWPADLPQRVVLKNTPFVAQQDYECGPAALAMVLQAAGVSAPLQQLVDQVYLPGRKGSLQVEMLAASRRHGMVAYLLQPQLEALLREVAAGHPVLVFQNLSLPVYPVWHYAVVTGFDSQRRTLFLHSGVTPHLEMSFFTFEQTWARGAKWSMAVVAPNHLPATAQLDAMAQSVAALERVNPSAAQTAYVTALKKWPNEPVLLLGLGNAAYVQKDLTAAADAYQTAVKNHPDFADGWNNLAQVLLELGQRKDAANAIAQAITLGGPRLPNYQRLQAKILDP